MPHPKSSQAHPTPIPQLGAISQLYLLEGMAKGGTEAWGGPQPFML